MGVYSSYTFSKHTQETTQAIQKDNYLTRAQLVAPYILESVEGMKDLTQREINILKTLRSWDYKSDTDSVGMTIFMAIYRKSILLALGNKVSAETRHVFVKQRYSTNIADGWFKQKDHVVWDDYRTPKHIEDRDNILRVAFRKAIADLDKNLGKEITNWQWGKLHYFQPKHLFGSKKILNFFNLKRIPLAGSLDSVWKAHFNLSNFSDPFKTVAGPVVRLSIDLAKPENAKYSIDTGQSGWPLDPHYGDQYQKWQKGELVPMLRDFDVIKEKFKERKLVLTP